MYRRLEMTLRARLSGAGGPQAADPARPADPDAGRPFDLLRWFSIVSFVAVFVFSVAFASILSHFLKQEILQRDAILTSQFVHSLAEVQIRSASLVTEATIGQILDARVELARLGVETGAADSVRSQFYDHLRALPDALLATVFAPDRKILWSTNPELVGRIDLGNDELEQALAAQVMVSTEYDANELPKKREQQFRREPARFFVENYIPLVGPNGEVTAVVEIYKEPLSLEQTIRRGQMLVWVSVAIGAAFLYFALSRIIRRADTLLKEQQRRLVEAEALCAIGEMSSAVAHGIRNPLASIRTSAELALDGDLDSTRKNAADIIAQVDRLGRWVRDLLVFSRPVAGEIQTLALDALVEECLRQFAPQFERGRIACEFVRPAVPPPPVLGNWALATQALASVVSNAIEAMPQGGELRLELKPEPRRRRVALVVADSGTGMSAAQAELAFKPFYTTKRKGLGLGMALAKRIMERFGGSVSLHSREGEGTRVTLDFGVA